jgi:NhaP-type Na+/H+ or K+/H+ antiporter
VNGILRAAGASIGLTHLAVGEALINDGSALILYTLFFRLVSAHGAHGISVEETVIYFIKVIFISPLIGIAVGVGSLIVIGAAKMKSIEGDTTIQLATTICCAYFSFYIAQRMLEVSGVIACCTAGVLLSRYATPRYLKAETIESVWSGIEWMGNTLLFFLAGLIIGNFAILKVEGRDILWIFVVYLFLNAVRYAASFTLYPFLLKTTKGKLHFNGILFVGWCGYRGASAFALSLSLYQSTVAGETTIELKQIERLIFLVGGVVTLTLLVNATLSKTFLQKFHLLEDDLSASHTHNHHTMNVSSFKRDYFRGQLAHVNSSHALNQSGKTTAGVTSPGGHHSERKISPPVNSHSFNRETKLMFEYLKKKIRLKAYNLLEQAQNHYLSSYLDLHFVFKHCSLLRNSPEAKLFLQVDDQNNNHNNSQHHNQDDDDASSLSEDDDEFSENEEEENENEIMIENSDEEEEDDEAGFYVENMSTKENISKRDYKIINEEVQELERKVKEKEKIEKKNRKRKEESSTLSFPAKLEILDEEVNPISHPMTLGSRSGNKKTTPNSAASQQHYEELAANRLTKLAIQDPSSLLSTDYYQNNNNNKGTNYPTNLSPRPTRPPQIETCNAPAKMSFASMAEEKLQKLVKSKRATQLVFTGEQKQTTPSSAGLRRRTVSKDSENTKNNTNKAETPSSASRRGRRSSSKERQPEEDKTTIATTTAAATVVVGPRLNVITEGDEEAGSRREIPFNQSVSEELRPPSSVIPSRPSKTVVQSIPFSEHNSERNTQFRSDSLGCVSNELEENENQPEKEAEESGGKYLSHQKHMEMTEERPQLSPEQQQPPEEPTSNKISVKNIFQDQSNFYNADNSNNHEIDLKSKRLSFRMLHNIVYPNLLLTMRKVFLEVLRVNYFKQINLEKLPRKSFAAILLLNSIDISLNTTSTSADKLNDLMILVNSHYYLKKLYQERDNTTRHQPLTEHHDSSGHNPHHSHYHNDYSVHLQTAVNVLIAYIEAHEFAQSRIAFYLGEHDGIDTPEEDIVISESKAFVQLAKDILLTIHEPILKYIYSKRMISSILSLQQNLVFEFQNEGIINMNYAEILFHEIHSDINFLSNFEKRKILPRHLHLQHHHQSDREEETHHPTELLQAHQTKASSSDPWQIKVKQDMIASYYLFFYYSEYYLEELINWGYLLYDEYIA